MRRCAGEPGLTCPVAAGDKRAMTAVPHKRAT
jgi:hypothetical protein